MAINYTKRNFVPIGVDGGQAGELAAILGCPVAAFPQTYLGLPMSDTKLPGRVLDDLAIPTERCIPGWRVQLLNRGGRLSCPVTVASPG